MNPQTSQKKTAAEFAARIVLEKANAVQDTFRLALGTGSTVAFFIDAVGNWPKSVLSRLQCVSTSNQSSEQAKHLSLPLVEFDSNFKKWGADACVDGVDRYLIEPSGEINGIKGGGGALLREKRVAECSRWNVWIADETKNTPSGKNLGHDFPLPLAIEPDRAQKLRNSLAPLLQLPIEKIAVRTQANNNPVVTDDGYWLLDISFPLGIPKPNELSKTLDGFRNQGLAEHGLFLGLTNQIILATHHGVVEQSVRRIHQI